PGVAHASRHLKAAGHTSTGSSPAPAATPNRAASRSALPPQGLGADAAPDASGPLSFEGGERAIGEPLPAGVTAVLCSTDILALGAISGADKLGVSVPRDLSIIGIDNLSFAPFTRPPLASVGIPRAEIAAAAVDALHQLVEDAMATTPPAPARQLIHTINTRFLPRASLGPAR